MLLCQFRVNKYQPNQNNFRIVLPQQRLFSQSYTDLDFSDSFQQTLYFSTSANTNKFKTVYMLNQHCQKIDCYNKFTFCKIELFMYLGFLLIFLVFGMWSAMAELIGLNLDKKGKVQFRGFQLTREIPETFVIGEQFNISGKITDSNFYPGNEVNQFYATLQIYDKGKLIQTCTYNFPIKNLTFSIKCSILKTGPFSLKLVAYPIDQMGIKLKDVNQTSDTLKNTISVISSPKQPILTPTSNRTLPPKPEGLQISYAKGNLFVKWTSQAALTNVTFYQKKGDTVTARKTFLVSSYLQEVSPMLFEFMEFEVGETLVEISHANSESGFFDKVSSKFGEEKSVVKFRALFNIVTIGYPQLYKSDPQLPEQLKINQILKLTLEFKRRIANYYIIQSYQKKTLKRITINKVLNGEEDSLKENTPIILSLLFDRSDTYTLQFYSSDRRIIFSQSIFVGGGVPLIPDYYDYIPLFELGNTSQYQTAIERYLAKTVTGKVISEPSPDSTLVNKKQYLFQLINAERKGYGVKSLVFDEKLNELAQNHSEDMKANRFLDVYSITKENILQRAFKANITTLVKLFVMDGTSLSANFIGTQQYLVMNELKINPLMTRIGIGITQIQNDLNNSLYLVAYCLSIRDLVADPPPLQQLDKFKNDLIAAVLERNPNIRQQDKKLSADMAAWVKQNKSNDAEELEDYLATGKYGKSLRVEKKMVTFYEQEVGYLKDEGALDNKKGSKVGLALSINRDSISSLTAFFAYI